MVATISVPSTAFNHWLRRLATPEADFPLLASLSRWVTVTREAQCGNQRLRRPRSPDREVKMAVHEALIRNSLLGYFCTKGVLVRPAHFLRCSKELKD